MILTLFLLMKRPAVSLIPLLAALGLLLGAVAAAGWGPGCPVRSWTGLKCPGCGSGRAMAALMGGDLPGAFYWNALLFPLVALLLAAGLRKGSRWWGRWAVLGLMVLAFGVLRNLPFYLLY